MRVTEIRPYRSIGIFDSDAGITSFSSAPQWQAAIDADLAKIAKGIKGEWPAGTATESESDTACGTDTQLDGFDHVINIIDRNVSDENDAFWASLNGQVYYVALWLCNSDELLIIEVPVNFSTPAAVVPLSVKSKHQYNAQLKFSVPANWYPIRAAAPAGIFS